MLDRISQIDKRWIYLLMGLSVLIPILTQLKFPESPSPFAQKVFDTIEALPVGSRVLMAWDYDPASEGEISPMAKAFILHCASRQLKLYFLTLIPAAEQLIEQDIDETIKIDFPDYKYGEDYVNLGYKPGYEGVIKVITTNLRELYTTDSKGTALSQIPMCRNITNIQEMDLIVEVSSSYPGTKEWVQFAVTPYPDKLSMVAGCTGVQAPLLYPYIPRQLAGLLGAIKGAAEYESIVVSRYGGEHPRKTYLEAQRRMGPQLIAHILMILLIVMGNIVYFAERNRPGARS